MSYMKLLFETLRELGVDYRKARWRTKKFKVCRSCKLLPIIDIDGKYEWCPHCGEIKYLTKKQS